MSNQQLELIREAVGFLIALILSVTVHEFGHAIVADLLGDDLPRRQGRVTLSPLAHAHPIGTILIPLITVVSMQLGFFAPLIGFGRPVQVNPLAFTRKLRMKTGHMLVALAGPAMNVLLATIVALIYTVVLALHVLPPNGELTRAIEMVITLNWTLVFFNLLPVPPLDGSAVLKGLLPDHLGRYIETIEQYGMLILYALMLTGALSFLLIPAHRLAGSYIWLARAIAL